METINKLGANVRCIDAAEGTLTRFPIPSSQVFSCAVYFSEYYAKIVGSV